MNVFWLLKSPNAKTPIQHVVCPQYYYFVVWSYYCLPPFQMYFPVIHHPHSGIYCSIVLHLYKQMWFAGVFFSNRSNFKHHESLCNSLNTGDWDRGFLCLPAVCVFLIISMTDHNSFFICNRYWQSLR